MSFGGLFDGGGGPGNSFSAALPAGAISHPRLLSGLSLGLQTNMEGGREMSRMGIGGGGGSLSAGDGNNNNSSSNKRDEQDGATGIAGLDVVPNAREVLISLYTKTLQEIKAVPENEGYRKAVESFTDHRLRVCQDEEDWEQIEKRIGCGQVEELIEEAQDELKLIDKMIEWDPWGLPDNYECEVIEDDSPIPAHVPHHRSPPLPEEFHRTLDAITSKPAPKVEASSESKA